MDDNVENKKVPQTDTNKTSPSYTFWLIIAGLIFIGTWKRLIEESAIGGSVVWVILCNLILALFYCPLVMLAMITDSLHEINMFKNALLILGCGSFIFPIIGALLFLLYGPRRRTTMFIINCLPFVVVPLMLWTFGITR